MSLLQADGAGVVGSDRPLPSNVPQEASSRVVDGAGAAPTARGEDRTSWTLAQRLHLSRMLLAKLRTGSAERVGQPSPLHSERADEEARRREMARDLGVPYAASIDPDALILRDGDFGATLRGAGGRLAVAENGGGAPLVFVAPEPARLPELRRLLSAEPAMAQRLRIVSPRTLRAAFMKRFAPQLLRNAHDGLFDRYPELSARIVLNAWQGAMVGAGMVLLPAALLFTLETTILVLHALFSLFFLSCVFLRLAAAVRAGQIEYQPLKPVRDAQLPVYTVLVALYREAEIVPDLLVALGRIVWPRGKLEIKLVCEADDAATLQAVEAQELRSFIEVVRVPPAGPRTKPKALAFALQISSGEFVALYDAEDRPHPLQLIEAWQRFRGAGPDLACVQAPLAISNWNRGVLARMFAFEYAALFRGLLPWLSQRRLMLPLGGTSNHFRRAALEQVGGWDPFNVTEDADLGLRLSRFGYRSETISRPTFEDAPDRFPVWLKQRTRWFKGWLQTWLVHMRNPVRLARELGPGSFIVAQILFAGMVISALVHPLIAITLAGLLAKIAWAGNLARFEAVLLTVDALNIALGYGAFLILGAKTLARQERDGLVQVILWTPVYWFLMSLAAWRAVWQLYKQPHLWEKTPHRRHRDVVAGLVDAPSGRA